jgi:hypothetical protein
MRWRVDEAEPEPDADDRADFDSVGLPHGGCWSRQDHGDELVCKEHALPVSEH